VAPIPPWISPDSSTASDWRSSCPAWLPSIGRSDGPPRVDVSGERRIGQGDPITPADRMHLGSLTKAITATLIGALAEKQLMTLETTIGQRGNLRH
jgi:Beta-lactamase